jgi:hypothetical protein
MRNRVTAGLCGLFAAAVLAGGLVAPVPAYARNRQQESKHRQQTKNQWRNIAYGSAAVGLFGLLKHDNTLTFAGAAGALYSVNRYEHDRKSQSKIDHARAAAFSRTSFVKNGHRYDRRTVRKNGKTYYQFVRADQYNHGQIVNAKAANMRRASYVKNGHRYDRRIVQKNGERYYQYVKTNHN